MSSQKRSKHQQAHAKGPTGMSPELLHFRGIMAAYVNYEVDCMRQIKVFADDFFAMPPRYQAMVPGIFVVYFCLFSLLFMPVSSRSLSLSSLGQHCFISLLSCSLSSSCLLSLSTSAAQTCPRTFKTSPMERT